MGNLLELAKLQVDEARRDSDRRAQAEAARARRSDARSLIRRIARPAKAA